MAVPQRLFLSFCILISLCGAQGQSLRAEYFSTSLPQTNAYSAAIYDGDDYIYIIGGAGNGPANKALYYTEILRFTVSTQSLEVIGNMPGTTYDGDSLQFDDQGNIFYFGADFTQVEMFDLKENSTKIVADLPDFIGYSDTAKHNGTVYIFGGSTNFDKDILQFDMNTMETTIIGVLPNAAYGTTCAQIGSMVYVTGSSTYGMPEGTIYKVDLDTLDIQPYAGVLPLLDGFAELVYTGDSMYLIGAHKPSFEFPVDGIFKLNPETMEATFMQVENFPVSGLEFYSAAPTTIYVEKENRIYFFGGKTTNVLWGTIIYHDQIWFIDL